MMPIALYQMGIIRHLPELPLPRLNADVVDAASEASAIPAMPDALLGLEGYTITAWLATMDGDDRAWTRPWIPLALAGKVVLDVATGAKLTVDQ
ncbi:MAG: hypothetical protein ACR2OU_04345 [Thermomicrobiales bacterium]